MDSPNENVKPGLGLCPHPRTALYRQPWSSGEGEHLVELCLTCLSNARGPGRWVSREEIRRLGLNPDELPQVPSRQQERSLFDLQGGPA
jgi:hypothetical protein